MSACEFCDDDDGYLNWLAAHPDGYVLNILRSHNPTGARVHRASCWTINRPTASGPWTNDYVKGCADDVAELDQRVDDAVGEPIARCKICHPTEPVERPNAANPVQKPTLPPKPEGRTEIQKPTENRPVLEAWADDYIRFESRPAWQNKLRDDIRTLSQQLEPSDEQVLHAAFFGAKRDNADIENLVLYNISTFKVSGRNGIRFEHGDKVPDAPEDATYPFAYRYALMPRSGTFDDWQQGRKLTSFDGIDLDSFAGEKKLAKVWLALKRAQLRAEVNVFEPARAPATPFAVKLEIQPPRGRQWVWGGLVKEIFDGVISAFQAQTDTTALPDVADRLAKVLPAGADEIAEYLVDQRWAVLGVVPHLVKPYRDGVQWHPADHRCLAGELLTASPAPDSGWAISGEIVEISR